MSPRARKKKKRKRAGGGGPDHGQPLRNGRLRGGQRHSSDTFWVFLPVPRWVIKFGEGTSGKKRIGNPPPKGAARVEHYGGGTPKSGGGEEKGRYGV